MTPSFKRWRRHPRSSSEEQTVLSRNLYYKLLTAPVGGIYFSQAGLFPRNDPRLTDPEQLEGPLSMTFTDICGSRSADSRRAAILPPPGHVNLYDDNLTDLRGDVGQRRDHQRVKSTGGFSSAGPVVKSRVPEYL